MNTPKQDPRTSGANEEGAALSPADRATVYDIIYALMARDGREAALFGSCAPLAREAFRRSCAGNAFPELWFELPMTGDPWFDLHSLHEPDAYACDTQLWPEGTGVRREVYEWFASEPNARQLALSYDVHTGDIDHPAVQLLTLSQHAHAPFLERAGGVDAAEAYRSFERRLPHGWFACYTGVFPGRSRKGIRVECIPSADLQQAYATDARLIEAHLRQVGLAELGDTVVPRCQQLTREPFQFEFQFDVNADGTTGSTLGASLRFPPMRDDNGSEPFSVLGAAGVVMRRLAGWGLVDDRWPLFASLPFSKRISRGNNSVVAAVFPAFIKLRWREGEQLDAKIYLNGLVR